MENLAALIDRIIEEHRVILDNARNLEGVANDAGALKSIQSGKEAFMPGRGNSPEGLRKLESQRGKLEIGLLAHFDREETLLLQGFRDYGDEKIFKSLETILNEHTVIRERLMELKGLVAELIAEPQSRHVWEAKAYDMRAHISNLYNLVKIHAAAEQQILHSVRKQISSKQN